MEPLGTCLQDACSNPATAVVLMDRTDRATGERTTHRFPVCAEHKKDLTTPCDADGCNRAPATLMLRLPTTGDEFTFCNRCRDTLRNSGSLTVRGMTLLARDGAVMLLPPAGVPPQG